MKIDKKVLEEIEEEINKKEIIMWDDAGFWMHTPDTLEKIQKDALALINGYIIGVGDIRSDFTSIRNAFRMMNLRTAFIMQLLNIFVRLGRLENND